MAHDPLKLITCQQLHRALSYGHYGVTGRMPGCKRVDAALIRQDVNLRHGNAGSDGHFLDDVQQLPFVRISRGRINQPSAEIRGYDAASLRKLCRFEKTAERNDG